MREYIYFEDQDRLLDSLVADYEDIFTFDTFKSLILSHHEHEKALLIARVTTGTINTQTNTIENVFYSYYNAYNLNKVIFRTQRSGFKMLLHRLAVLNPLNNLEIIGNVEYFKVIPSILTPISVSPQSPCPKNPPSFNMTVKSHKVLEAELVESEISKTTPASGESLGEGKFPLTINTVDGKHFQGLVN